MLRTLAVWIALSLTAAPGVGQPAVMHSLFSAEDVPLVPDPDHEAWKSAPRVEASRDRSSQPVPGPPTEIRSRWTTGHLYFLFICPYTDLTLKPDPDRDKETPHLWNWDVVEAFIGSDFERIWNYKEFQASPQGEWVDLDIDSRHLDSQEDQRWDSGFSVAARIDREARIWYAVMRIPFRAIDARPPVKGRELRLGLFRLAGAADTRTRWVWQPSGERTFHVPEAFGILSLR